MSPITVAEPSVAVTSKLTRKVAPLTLVMLSVALVPLSVAAVNPSPFRMGLISSSALD